MKYSLSLFAHRLIDHCLKVKHCYQNPFQFGRSVASTIMWASQETNNLVTLPMKREKYACPAVFTEHCRIVWMGPKSWVIFL